MNTRYLTCILVGHDDDFVGMGSHGRHVCRRCGRVEWVDWP